MKRALKLFCICGGAAAAAAAATIIRPPCLFKALTGYSCPACGSTRAFTALLRGDIEGSLTANLMFIPQAAVLLFLCIYTAYFHICGRRPGKAVLCILVFILVVFIGWGVLRNIINC